MKRCCSGMPELEPYFQTPVGMFKHVGSNIEPVKPKKYLTIVNGKKKVNIFANYYPFCGKEIPE